MYANGEQPRRRSRQPLIRCPNRTGPQPSPIPPPDRHQIERLNSLYQIIDAPAAGGLKSRLASTARRLLGRVLSRQQEFNAALVDHINRDAAVAVEAHEASLKTIEWIGGAINQWDGIRRHTESLLARERRNDTSVAALAAQHDELRSAVSVLQQAAQNLKREVARLAGGGTSTPNSQLPTPKANTAPGNATDTVPGNQFDDLDSHKYVGFEDQFRGSPEDIQRRVAEYLPTFLGIGDRGSGIKASDVLDVGCGRGEFLALLREHGISARGIDVNPAMVEVCRAHGLDAVTTDGARLLCAPSRTVLSGDCCGAGNRASRAALPDALLDAAFDKLRPGGRSCSRRLIPLLVRVLESYIRDLTHVRPRHPDTLKYMLIATAFSTWRTSVSRPYRRATSCRK